jgi:hypothetical protein
MTIPLRARKIDLLNLVVSKTSNFSITLIIFAVVTHGMDAKNFGLFGYWWSIGLMVGGVLLGGLSSSAVRSLMVSGTLGPSLRIGVMLIMAALVLFLGIASVAYVFDILKFEQLWLAGAVGLFGISVMFQAIFFGLLRALEASRVNLITSVVVVLITPSICWFLIDKNTELPRLFGVLATAFAIGTVVSIVIAWSKFRDLCRFGSADVSGSRLVFRDTVAFTSLNIFTYLVLNIDFTLIKLLGTPDEFAVLASGKVYFERFLLPALFVYAGAISLRVLRQINHPADSPARIEFKNSGFFIVGTIFLVAGVATGYWVFSALIRNDAYQLTWATAITATAGYLLYAFNAVLLDVLVLRAPTRVVLTYVLAFILLCFAVQWLAFMAFQVPGWGVGWFIFNALVTAALSFKCLHLKPS